MSTWYKATKSFFYIDNGQRIVCANCSHHQQRSRSELTHFSHIGLYRHFRTYTQCHELHRLEIEEEDNNQIALSVLPPQEQGGDAGVRYAANPCFGTKGAARQNWALLNYGSKGGEVACHLLVFFHLPSKPRQPIRLNSSIVSAAGHYVCCHVLPCQLDMGRRETAEDMNYYELAHPDQRLIFRCQKWDVRADRHGENPEYNRIFSKDRIVPSLRFESCECISGPIIAIPDFHKEEMEGHHNHVYYILRQHREWASDFAAYAKDHQMRGGSKAGPRRRLVNALHAKGTTAGNR